MSVFPGVPLSFGGHNFLVVTFYKFMPPFEEGGAYCVAHVGRYVGRSVSMSVIP